MKDVLNAVMRLFRTVEDVMWVISYGKVQPASSNAMKAGQMLTSKLTHFAPHAIKDVISVMDLLLTNAQPVHKAGIMTATLHVLLAAPHAPSVQDQAAMSVRDVTHPHIS